MLTPDPDSTDRSEDPMRWAWAEVDAGAIAGNVEQIRALVAPSDVWAVVKANGYGHGAVTVARAALAGGAVGLGVALVQEGVELRDAGIEGPILLLSEQPPDLVPAIVEHALTPTAYSTTFLDALAAEATRRQTELDVHIKIDTGMQRVGVQPAEFPTLVGHLRALAPVLRLAGVFTHLAVADEPADEFTAAQLAAFDELLAATGLGAAGAGRAGDTATTGPVLVHAANSAGALAHPTARRSFVRAGIAIYGISPGPGVDEFAASLRPALSLRARVAHVKRVAAGSRVSYGLRHMFERDTIVATIPLGYADGVPRRLSATGGEVLIGGLRRPMVGVVTMDQLVVECGQPGVPGSEVRVGDEVVLIGEQTGPDGPQRITAEDWAARLGTIGYEIVCGISGRVPRVTARSISR